MKILNMKSVKVLTILTAVLISSVPAPGAENLHQREAQLLAEIKRSQDSSLLIELARVRERLGHFNEAINTWAQVKKLSGKQQAPHQSSAPNYSLGRMADFYMHRVQRKRNLLSHPPKLDLQLRRRIADAAMEFGDQPPVDQLDFAVQADLDGDLIDEFFYIGSHGPLGKRTRKSMGIARWNGKAYQVVWRTERRVPFMVHVVDEDGDGWKEIFCGYTPDTDDAATLHFNGKEAMFL